MRVRALAPLFLLALASSTCRVGSGAGTADGKLFVRECYDHNQDFGTREVPAPYRLEPRFFAGEPLDDIKKEGTDNRLIIRLQSSGKRIEVNDMLAFDIVSTFEVARCVYGGKKPDGKPDYETDNCSWGPDGKGPPRIRVGVDQPIRANFVPRTTCPHDMGRRAPAAQGAYAVGTAISGERLEVGNAPATNDAGAPAAADAGATDPSQWESWIEFEQFGSASNGKPGAGFKVEFGERIHASLFHISFTDDRVIKAIHLNERMVPTADIMGVLDGYFDFDLERGQGAQTFP
jgi:hypothetical protein